MSYPYTIVYGVAPASNTKSLMSVSECDSCGKSITDNDSEENEHGLFCRRCFNDAQLDDELNRR